MIQLDKKQKLAIASVVAFVILITLAQCAFAYKPGHEDIDIDITNNYQAPPDGDTGDLGGGNLDTQATGDTYLTRGVSGKDLRRGMTASMAMGLHQFDFSTTDHQVSVTYAFEASNEDDGNASVAYARNWKNVSWMPNALVHIEYAENDGDDYIGFGGTFRIK